MAASYTRILPPHLAYGGKVQITPDAKDPADHAVAMYDWLENGENGCTGKYNAVDIHHLGEPDRIDFWFSDPNTAVLFKLRWC